VQDLLNKSNLQVKDSVFLLIVNTGGSKKKNLRQQEDIYHFKPNPKNNH